MSFTVTWYDTTQTILRIDTDGIWTWDDYDKAIDHTCELASSVKHKVQIVVVQSRFTPNGSPIQHIQRATTILPRNVTKLVIVGGSLFLRSLYEVLIKVNPRLTEQIVFAATLDEALDLITGQNAA